jgi:hypothetical protein
VRGCDQARQFELIRLRGWKAVHLRFIDIDVAGCAIEAAAALSVDAIANHRKHHALAGSDLDPILGAVRLNESDLRHRSILQ